MGRRSNEANHRRVSLLRRIRSNKELLFGKFSTDVENGEKTKAWNDVLSYAKRLAIVDPSRDYYFFRDKIWGTWKSRAIKKKEEVEACRRAGQTKSYSDVDKIILDILGMAKMEEEDDNNLTNGELEDPDGDGGAAQAGNESEEDDSRRRRRHQSRLKINMPAGPAPPPPPSGKRKLVRLVTSKTSSSEKEKVLLQKWKSQTRLLEQQAYNMMLQNYKLEQDLGLPHSSFTAPIRDGNFTNGLLIKTKTNDGESEEEGSDKD